MSENIAAAGAGLAEDAAAEAEQHGAETVADRLPELDVALHLGLGAARHPELDVGLGAARHLDQDVALHLGLGAARHLDQDAKVFWRLPR